ncbi:MAG: c-type cytochrome [Sphingobacteriales bacterium]|nr:c-type cytochrome [Sphingobacteriales bacterium]
MKVLLLGGFLLLFFAQPVWAAGPPAESPFNNPLAVVLVILMALLLIIIGILANILVGAADIKLKKKKNKTVVQVTMLIFLLLISGSPLFAQDTGNNGNSAAKTIGGMQSSTFYIMATVIFLELLVIIGLLLNIRVLLKQEKEKLSPEMVEEIKIAKSSRLTWWDKFNKLRPVTQESELDLGHDYDGIRELNNRLPPWWLYGFYFTILFAAVYLWRYHVSHTAPLSGEEYTRSVESAQLKVQEYLKKKGENINENTVVLLTDKADLDAGKELFTNGACAGCHGKDGSGMVMGQPGVGPNLTDDYWINGGSIKSVFTTIKYGGRPNKGMQAWENTYSAKQIAQLASYVKSLIGTNPAVHKTADGELYKEETTVKPVADSAKSKTDSIKTKTDKQP